MYLHRIFLHYLADYSNSIEQSLFLANYQLLSWPKIRGPLVEIGGRLLYFQDPSSFRMLSQLNLAHVIKIYICFELLSEGYTVVDVITLCIPIFVRNKQTRFYMAFVLDIYRFQVIQTACMLALLIQQKCFVYCDLSGNKYVIHVPKQQSMDLSKGICVNLLTFVLYLDKCSGKYIN